MRSRRPVVVVVDRRRRTSIPGARSDAPTLALWLLLAVGGVVVTLWALLMQIVG